jgi:hypothetical protein
MQNINKLRVLLLRLIFLAVTIVFGCLKAYALQLPEYGRFTGPLDLRMSKDGRTAKLLESFGYIDPQGKEWSAPKGHTVDGASIPRPLWTIIGGPWEGRYREASVIHDYYCDSKSEPWKAVHKTFFTAMLANGVNMLQAKIMYAGVYRFGPRWNFQYTPKCPNCLTVPYQVESFKPQFNANEFEALKRNVESSDPSLEQIENDADLAVQKELEDQEVGEPVFIH